MSRICRETGGIRAGCASANGEMGEVDEACAGCEQLYDSDENASLRAEVARSFFEARPGFFEAELVRMVGRVHGETGATGATAPKPAESMEPVEIEGFVNGSVIGRA